MNKKNWINPEIGAVDIKETEYETLEGNKVDGQYQDHDKDGCFWEDAYYNS